MATEQILVTIHRFESGQLKAFADVTLATPVGELTFRGFRILQKADNPPWVAFPATSYQQNGITKYKNIIDAAQAAQRQLTEAILNVFHTDEGSFRSSSPS